MRYRSVVICKDIYVLLYEGKCKWSYGPSCPLDFPLNIFIHSFIHSRRTHFTTTTLQPFNALFSRTTRVSWYQKGKTNLDFTGARDSEWQWHQLGYMQVCTSLQTDNHASTPPICLLQAGCPSCRPTNSVKALKAQSYSF